MRERKLSVIGGRASKVVALKKPSQLIPFRGDFPLLEQYEVKPYLEAIQSSENIEDLSERFQKVTELGNRIVLLEDGFVRYLSGFNISPDDFMKLSNSDKSDKLMSWLNHDCIDFSQLKIKITWQIF